MAQLHAQPPQPQPPKWPDPWSTITEIGLQERAFNTLQATYRTLASTWLLATFAAVGFVWSQRANVALSVPVEVVVLFIGIAGAVGITLVWLLDLLVYHRLLEVVFWTGLAVELEYEQIPPMRLHMYSLEAVTPLVKLFYMAMLAAPLTIATFGAAWSAHLVSSGTEPLVVIIAFAISTLWISVVERQSESHRDAVLGYFATIKARADDWKDDWILRAAVVLANIQR
jgi:hypothetical protein